VTAWVMDLINDLTNLARAGLVVLALIAIGKVWWETKALVPVLGAILMSGVVIWATSPAGIQWLKDRTKQEADDHTTSMGRPDAVHRGADVIAIRTGGRVVVVVDGRGRVAA
jgi:hypothetical protein